MGTRRAVDLADLKGQCSEMVNQMAVGWANPRAVRCLRVLARADDLGDPKGH